MITPIIDNCGVNEQVAAVPTAIIKILNIVGKLGLSTLANTPVIIIITGVKLFNIWMNPTFNNR